MAETPFYINGVPAPPPTEAKPEPWLRPELVAPWGEIALVVALMVGPFAARSTWSFLHGSDTTYIKHFLSDKVLMGNVAVEGGMLAMFFAFLHWRKWKVADFRIKPGIWQTLLGMALVVPAYVANGFVVMGAFGVWFLLQYGHSDFTSFVLANSPKVHNTHIDVSMTVILGTMILNAFFEELTCMAYAFTQFAAKLGPAPALGLTVLLRMSCHSYQGPAHMLGVGMLFLFYGLIYWWTRNLWILVISHATLDTVSFGLLKMMSNS